MHLLRYLWVLLLLVAAAVAGVWLRHDPGLLLIRLRGWELRSTLLFGVLALLLLLLLLGLLWWLLTQAPRRLRERRLARRLRDLDLATLARIEGRPRLAEQLLERAAEHPAVRAGALLQAAEAAMQQRMDERAQAYLGRAVAQPAAQPSTRLLGLALREDDADSLADLERLAGTTNPPPAALTLLAGRLAQRGQWQAALAVRAQAARSRSMLPEQLATLDRELLLQLLERAADVDALLAIWRGLGDRALRRQPEAIQALARAERRLGHEGLAADALEAALKKSWSEALAALYGEVPLTPAGKLLKRAEQRLATHPQSPGLLLALAQLCRRDELWGKARDYLSLALSLAPGAQAWEEWAELHEQIGEPAQARRGYRNALRALRGEAAESSAGH